MMRSTMTTFAAAFNRGINPLPVERPNAPRRDRTAPRGGSRRRASTFDAGIPQMEADQNRANARANARTTRVDASPARQPVRERPQVETGSTWKYAGTVKMSRIKAKTGVAYTLTVKGTATYVVAWNREARVWEWLLETAKGRTVTGKAAERDAALASINGAAVKLALGTVRA